LDGAIKSAMQMGHSRLDRAAAGLRPSDAKRDVKRAAKQIDDLAGRMQAAVKNITLREAEGLARYDRLLESYSYRNVLKRGFAVVRDGEGQLVGKSADIVTGQAYDLEMGDGVTRVTAGEGGATTSVATGGSGGGSEKPDQNIATSKPEKLVKPKPVKKKKPNPQDDDRQGSLL